VQPFSIKAKASTPRIIAERFNISDLSPSAAVQKSETWLKSYELRNRDTSLCINKCGTRNFQDDPSRNREVRRGKIG
jgi:hypothetical protein